MHFCLQNYFTVFNVFGVNFCNADVLAVNWCKNKIMNNIFDSHAHYDDEKYCQDRDETLEKVFSSGVCGIINCGSDIDSSIQSINLSKKYDKIYSAVGVIITKI